MLGTPIGLSRAARGISVQASTSTHFERCSVSYCRVSASCRVFMLIERQEKTEAL